MESDRRIVVMPTVAKKERSVQLNLTDESYEPPVQLVALLSESGELMDIIKKQLNIKLQGYRAQDTIKKMFVESEFMDLENTVQLLKESCLMCYYCRGAVKVLYKHVREGCQWTLERIDNDYGHNKTNVVIACLDCNLRRRTMYHERYAFTKQLIVTKNK